MNKKRVVIDTNIWISYLITQNYNFIDELINKRKITLIFSEELLQEFMAVALRPKLEKYFSNQDISELLVLINNFGKLVKGITKLELCRDPNDNFLLNLALDSKSDFLVTGDNDLLVLKNIGETAIISISEFKEIAKDL